MFGQKMSWQLQNTNTCTLFNIVILTRNMSYLTLVPPGTFSVCSRYSSDTVMRPGGLELMGSAGNGGQLPWWSQFPTQRGPLSCLSVRYNHLFQFSIPPLTPIFFLGTTHITLYSTQNNPLIRCEMQDYKTITHLESRTPFSLNILYLVFEYLPSTLSSSHNIEQIVLTNVTQKKSMIKFFERIRDE